MPPTCGRFTLNAAHTRRESAFSSANGCLVAGAGIAQVVLRRQQAEAIIVALDGERKAAMVSNLLVVLCSDKETQPIVNTGTLYN
ncbi:hypothetical protein ABIB38_002867 [Massilia sp. UYP11]|uniref:hypothetical protein n=1 Tax=Massilia sp. UYP11 TaxID=1756385 RepID=UPI003D209B27